MEQKVSIELTLNEWNYVMAALARMPFGEVSALITEVKRQAEEKLKPAEEN
jgi:hypothetical protein